MLKINLLPTELRRIRRVRRGPDRILIYELLALFILIGFFYFTNASQNARIESLDRELLVAQRQMEKLEKKVAAIQKIQQIKDEISSKMKAIQMLEATRAIQVKILEEIATLLPDYSWLTNISISEDGHISLSGKGYSLKNIEVFMKRLISSPILRNVSLSFIREEAGSSPKTFSYKFDFDLIKEAGITEAGEFSIPEEFKPKRERRPGVPAGKMLIKKGKEALGVDKERARRMMEGLR
ncbi:PilN domain-containing protein [bacterium]|nr:PilN domain-containing protein [bacterium]